MEAKPMAQNSIVVRLGQQLFSPTDRRKLLIGVVCFFLIKVAFISFGLFSMHGPRIGDDSLVYLWFSNGAEYSVLAESKGVESILEFSNQIDAEQLSDKDRFTFFRPIMRLVGHPKNNFFHGIFGPLWETSFSYYQMFWIQELFVSVIMALGIYVLFSAAPMLPGLMFTLPLAALAIFPGQGLHFLIPGTLALSFGMIVWGLVLRAEQRSILIGLVGFLAMLSHTIGIVHAGLGGLLAILLYLTKKTSFRRMFSDGLALSIALAVYVGLIWIGILTPGISLGYTDIGVQYILGNLTGLLPYFAEFAEKSPAALIFVLFGAYAFYRNYKQFSGLALLAGLVIGVAILAGVYQIEAYEGNAVIRLFVVLFLLLFCFAYVRDQSGTHPPHSEAQLRSAGLFYILLVFVSVLSCLDYSLGNREKRWPQIERAVIQNVMADLGPNDHVVYYDDDFVLQASFIDGGSKHFSSTSTLLNLSTQAAKNWLDKFPPTHAIGLMPRTLLPYRKYDSPLFSARAYGFKIDSRSELELSVPGQITSLNLSVSEDSSISASSENSDCSISASASDGQLIIDLSDCSDTDGEANRIQISGTGFVSGISLASQPSTVSWPWGSEIKFVYRYKSLFGFRYPEIRSGFSFSDLSKRLDGPSLADHQVRLVPERDDGGLVVLRFSGQQ